MKKSGVTKLLASKMEPQQDFPNVRNCESQHPELRSSSMNSSLRESGASTTRPGCAKLREERKLLEWVGSSAVALGPDLAKLRAGGAMPSKVRSGVRGDNPNWARPEAENDNPIPAGLCEGGGNPE